MLESDSIDVVVNGEQQNLAAPITIAALLDQRGLTGKRVAVERNGVIVPRSQHADVALLAGDKLEIVVAVGGG